MRIISANIAIALMLLSATAPLSASDIEYPPERIKTYRSYEKCLAALKRKHIEARATEHSSIDETPSGRRTDSVYVTGVYYGGPKNASFTIQYQTALEPKAGGQDGYRFGSGITWACEGHIMFKSGGHSAQVTIPAPPLPPPLPPKPEAQ
jgi:hypothetical protein